MGKKKYDGVKISIEIEVRHGDLWSWKMTQQHDPPMLASIGNQIIA
ncbi:MAG: hypothetical protein PHG75_06370 [Syntrophomonas sp.]|nr:hypothetical protein [Syntrophomonas sp.]